MGWRKRRGSLGLGILSYLNTLTSCWRERYMYISVFVEEISGTKFSNKVNKIYWENLICFELSLLSTRSVIRNYFSLLVEDFKFYSWTGYAGYFRRSSKTVHLPSYTNSRNVDSISPYRRPCSHRGTWAPLAVFPKNLKKYSFRFIIICWGNPRN